MAVLRILSLFGAVTLLVPQGAVSRRSGPFNVVLEKLDKCPDLGTNESIFPTKLTKVSRDKAVLSDTFRLWPDIDEQSKFEVELQEWGNQGYRPRTFQVTIKTCKKILKEGGYILKQLFGSAGYNITDCPIPKGTYTTSNLVWDLKPARMPVLLYNKYRIVASLFHGMNKVGCARLYVDVVPKDGP